MAISLASVEAAAPDQASLKAASKLMSPGKWPERARTGDAALIWGACQGSGANPYRVAVDLSDLGAKCSCPSRKFPCKHALALMLQYAQTPGDFGTGTPPDWVAEWLGRRRKTGANPAGADAPKTNNNKSLSDALKADDATPDDPKAQARREAARIRRAAETRAAITGGMADLEGWISDQLRTGLSDLLANLPDRCRRIAARMVDAKAPVLAGRIDGIPGRVLALPQAVRVDALVGELGRLVIMARAWGDGTEARPDLKREITAAEARDDLIADAGAPRQTGLWEVLVSRDETRRDGLIERATWLMALGDGAHRFAVLVDYFPAATGKQAAAFAQGAQIEAELVFYPAARPLRAQIVTQRPAPGDGTWPAVPATDDLLRPHAEALTATPWQMRTPLLLPPGRLAAAEDAVWWTSGDAALPLETAPDPVLLGCALDATIVLWDGFAAQFLAAMTPLGRAEANG